MLRKKTTPTKTKYKDLFPSVLRSFLHRFVLVFFDDILVYNRYGQSTCGSSSPHCSGTSCS
jgi:hypothetical protein